MRCTMFTVYACRLWFRHCLISNNMHTEKPLHSFFYNTRSLRSYILNGRLVRVMQFSALLHFPINRAHSNNTLTISFWFRNTAAVALPSLGLVGCLSFFGMCCGSASVLLSFTNLYCADGLTAICCAALSLSLLKVARVCGCVMHFYTILDVRIYVSCCATQAML